MDTEEPMDEEGPGIHQQMEAHNDAATLTPQSPQLYKSPHLQQVSSSEYMEQAVGYTQQALKELKASPDFKKHMQRCHSCGASWYGGQWGEGCLECGEYAMHQPCPVCSGQCGKTWTRSVDMSHRTHEAHWDGTCGLSPEQQAACMFRKFVQSESELADALEDLST